MTTSSPSLKIGMPIAKANKTGETIMMNKEEMDRIADTHMLAFDDGRRGYA